MHRKAQKHTECSYTVVILLSRAFGTEVPSRAGSVPARFIILKWAGPAWHVGSDWHRCWHVMFTTAIANRAELCRHSFKWWCRAVLRAGTVSSGSSRLDKNYIPLKYNYTVATEPVPVPKYKTLKEPVPESRNKCYNGTIGFHEAKNVRVNECIACCVNPDPLLASLS